MKTERIYPMAMLPIFAGIETKYKLHWMCLHKPLCIYIYVCVV